MPWDPLDVLLAGRQVGAEFSIGGNAREAGVDRREIVEQRVAENGRLQAEVAGRPAPAAALER